MAAGITTHQHLENLRASYDQVAADYVTHIYHELEGKPLDREILNRFAERLRDNGVVCDMGCGPGQIARYLADQGLDMIGVDLSPGMVAQATALNPDIPFRTGNMLALDEPDGAWAGIVAFYAIIHIPREKVTVALTELRRVLRPAGWLLLSFHMGSDVLHETEMWGHDVVLDYWFYEVSEMTTYLEQAGFQVVEVIEREPYSPDVEYQSRRGYILAQKPGP